jgi:tmRNA-binding protein
MARKDNKDEKKIVATNRKARQFFEILDVLEAGLQLAGPEVKSLRNGQASLDGCYARPNDSGELFLHNFYIPPTPSTPRPSRSTRAATASSCSTAPRSARSRAS